MMPQRYREKIKEWIKYSGSGVSPEGFTNYSFAFSICIGVITGLLAGTYFLIVFPAVFAAAFVFFHGFLMLAVDRRTKFVENILPDALQLMAANSRAGYIPSRALLLSARKEFGPLSDAIKTVGKDIMTGASLDESLKKITGCIKSELLDRTINLIIEGTRSGGQFASLLEENANDIRRMQVIRKDVKANVMMYTIFIAFAGCIGAPVLYALSSFLISTIGELGAAITMPEASAGNMPFMKFGGLEISPEFLLLFSIVAILITTVSGSIIVGLIGTGRERAGIKYIPVFMVLGLVVFFLTKIMISSTFGVFAP